MERFIQKHTDDVIGTLSGFDRLVLRGTLRALAVTSGMMDFLWRVGVLLKDFGQFVQAVSDRLKAASLEAANRLNRPIRYLPSGQTSKEPIAREIAEADGITDGLICVLTCVEPCMSYGVRRDRAKKRLVLQPQLRKCLHLYHYWMDADFGLMHGRIQTWFPFGIRVYLNGREWLGRQMDRRRLRYERRGNCFAWLEDVAASQALMDRLLHLRWWEWLRCIANQLNPAHEAMLHPYRVDYYWSVHQSEWATDVMFASPSALARIYPALVRGGIAAFGARDVMRFLGKRLRCDFSGEVVSDYRQRPEGIRLKHSLNSNSVKIYDKQGSVLRVETTINDPYDFRVFRRKQGDPRGPRAWRRLRKGVADLQRRGRVSQAANERYLDALACISTDRPLREVVCGVCRAKRWKGRRVRALRPWSAADRALLAAIRRGEFAINGIRNRDLLAQLFPRALKCQTQRRRASYRVTRLLRLLRAHGLIRKVPRTHRYVLTPKGNDVATAIIEYQDLTLEQLIKAVA